MNNPNFNFLVRVGRILADCGPDIALQSADVIEVDGRIVYWPHSAQDAADSEIRVFDSWEAASATIDAALDSWRAAIATATGAA